MLAKQSRKKPKYNFDALQGAVNSWFNMLSISVEPVLSKRNNKWVIMLEEKWPPGAPLGTTNLLDERINWCTEKLKDWPGCKRMAYDQFWFDRKSQAEKFITFYTLAWR